MKKWIARSAVGLTVLVSGAGAAFMVLADMGDRKLARRIDVAVAPVAFRSDAASVERGAYLFKSRGCGDCHGADGAGHVVVDDGKGMLVRSPDITPAPSGVVARYTPSDWVRTIRHGVKPDGRPVMIMPSEDYNRLVDADLAAIVAYVRQLPAATGAQGRDSPADAASRRSTPAGVVRDASEKIDHTLPPAQPVAEGVTPAHGAYVANGCIGCHGAKLAGGKIPGAPPDWPPAAKLTPGPGQRARSLPDAPSSSWRCCKTGKRPDGSSVSKVMPFVSLKEMNEVDVRALYLHLRSLPAGS